MNTCLAICTTTATGQTDFEQPDLAEGHTAMPPFALLTPARYQHVAALVDALAQAWSAELEHDVYGDATIIILSDDLDDDASPALILSSRDGVYCVEELQGDNFRQLGEYPAWQETIAAVSTWLRWVSSVPGALH
jgi:hypothetical protein